ncbi:sensor histidine kinase [Paenibacillus elgii]|uniref:histidine kinase n=1 Tax=Paenibacillus elgii TaxID=189691 RepID=A0A2T6FWD1_9BACL|nr:sensor histidine kinase [Paenibacillus elgii]PUA36217.1 sensor histidine kinase [Paenibacillus elgii]
MEKSFFQMIDQNVSHVISTLALLLLVYNHVFFYGFQVFGIGTGIVAVYVWMLWSNPSSWNASRYILVTAILIAAVVMVRGLHTGYPDNFLLWPLVFLLARAQPAWSRVTTSLAVLTGVVIVLLSCTDKISYGDILALIGVYISIRSLTLLKVANQENERQLVELKQAHAELQEAAVHSMRYAAITERTRLARDIHDGLGHHMTSLIVQLQALKLIFGKEPAAAEESVEELLKVARKGMEEIRTAVREWSDDEKGLGIIALKGLVSQTQSNSKLQIEFFQRGNISEWTLERSTVLYRILQESLTNILRHADADHATVTVEEASGRVRLTVADNGTYNGKKPLESGFGLSGMKERCESVNGHCSFSFNKPQGLKVEAVIPLT